MSRVLNLLLAALIGSAADSWWSCTHYAYRDPDLALFPQTFVLWLCFSLLALLPTLVVVGLWERLSPSFNRKAGAGMAAGDVPKRRRRLREFSVLFLAVAGAVGAHGVLDNFTGIGGNLAALKNWKPWATIGGGGLFGLALVYAVDRLLGDRNLRPVGVLVGALSILLGCFASSRPADGIGKVRSILDAPITQADSEHPNVLFMVWDTTRSKSLDLYGYDRATTPHLAELASECLVFENARSATVFTLSSHISMLTGIYASEHRASLTRQRFDPFKNPSVARLLAEAGYRTGAFVGTDVLRGSTAVIDGFEAYDDRTDPPVTYTKAWGLLHDVQSVLASVVPSLDFNGRPHWIQDFQRPAGPVLENASEWINNGDPRPWFCFVNLYDVHWPYIPDQVHREKWVGDYDGPMNGFSFRRNGVGKDYDANDEDNAHIQELYESELTQLDQEVKRFLGQIQRGTGPVALLLTSDHGEAFGESGRYEHSDIVEPQVRIPMLVKPVRESPAPPGIYTTPVSGVDVAPTLMALTGLDVPQMDGRGDSPSLQSIYAGTNLLALAAEPQRPDRLVLVEDRDKLDEDEFRIALYEGNWKLVRNGLGGNVRWELFNLEEDSLEQTNLFEQESAVALRLQAALRELRAEWDPVDELGPGISNANAMSGLGYVGDSSED